MVLGGFHQRDVTQPRNRNEIYASLLKDIIARRHAKHEALAGVEEFQKRERFERLLETIATAAWYGDGRTATMQEVRDLCPPDLRETLDELIKEKGGFTRLVAAFYLQEASARRDGSEAFEFTHKSFGEYLTARRLVREIARICKGRRESPDYYREPQALSEWAALTAAQAMTMDLLRFVRDEVALRPKDEVVVWQVTLTSLFNLELRTGFPLSALSSDGFREAERQSRNAEEALFAALNACARITEEQIALSWPHVTSAGDMLHRLRRQREPSESSVALACLLHLQLESQELGRQDLGGAELCFANLSGARLFDATLFDADLSEADLDFAELSFANLVGADLSFADLGEADLSFANLSDADLSDADLILACFESANLQLADLGRADLREADLREAKNLTREQIESAGNRRGAKLPKHLEDLEVAWGDGSERSGA